MKKYLLLVFLLVVTGLCLAATPGHPNWVSFERTGATTGTIRWSSEPSTDVGYYYFGLFPTDEKKYPPSYCDPDWNIAGGYVGEFVVESPGVLKNDVTALDPLKDYYAYVAAVETSGWSWAAYSSWETDENPPPAGFTFEVNAYDLDWYATTMGYTFPLLVPPYNDPNDLVSEILLNGFSFDHPALDPPWPVKIYTPYTFGLSGAYPFVTGTYSVVEPGYVDWLPTDITFFSITTNYAADFLGITDDQTPVELSSFTATLDAQNYVQLTWTSQTETNMLGYRVYRNETSEQASATMITPVLIPATNTSAQQTYTLNDSEVEIGHIYYYWLECVDINSSAFHGPMSIVVNGEVPPVLPELSSMRNAYPNPFQANTSTTIEVDVKAGETGTVTIYNLSGQTIRSFNITQGTHNINWNGLDSNGDICSSGVYFYKLSTPSFSQAKKLVIIK